MRFIFNLPRVIRERSVGRARLGGLLRGCQIWRLTEPKYTEKISQQVPYLSYLMPTCPQLAQIQQAYYTNDYVNSDHNQRSGDRIKPGIANLGLNWSILTPNLRNLCLFHTPDPKCIELCFEKVHDSFHLWQIYSVLCPNNMRCVNCAGIYFHTYVTVQIVGGLQQALGQSYR